MKVYWNKPVVMNYFDYLDNDYVWISFQFENDFLITSDPYQVPNISSNDKQNKFLLFVELHHNYFQTDIEDQSIENQISICSREKISKITLDFFACRRKNVLQDIQLITLKFIPRATSPHTRQIDGKADVRFVFIYSIMHSTLFFIIFKSVYK